MNWVVIVVAILQIGAAAYSLLNTDWRFALMWLSIATANIMLFLIEANR